MSKQKQPPTPEEYKEMFQQYQLTYQIEIYQWIKEFLENAKKQAQDVHNQLAQVVKEK